MSDLAAVLTINRTVLGGSRRLIRGPDTHRKLPGEIRPRSEWQHGNYNHGTTAESPQTSPA